jgi:DNA-binding beta-propeller fold protein YncE
MSSSIPYLALAALLLRITSPSLLADKIVLVAGGGDGGDNLPATQARLNTPFGVDFDQAGNMFIVEMAGGERVRRVDALGLLTTIAGTGEKGGTGDGGPALQARFNGMHSLALAPDGDIFVTDTWNNRVRKINAKTRVVSAFAGTGEKGFSGDGGRATEARFGGVFCAAFDAKGENLLLADLDNRRIRLVHLKTGLVKTVAGNGQRGVPVDGADPLASPLLDPRAVASDSKGRIYILERSGHALRVVETDGKIYTVAGSGKKGLSGDGGDARQATLSGPKHLCVDRDDNVIIADTDNHVIRKYLPREKKIVRVAGTGHQGSAGVGRPAEQAEFNQPHGVCVHRDGTLYIADSLNNRVLKIER